MPQLNKGGKYVFGWSTIGDDGVIRIPDQAIEEYGLSENDTVVLMSGSKRSGAFSVSSFPLMKDSILSSLLKEHPELERMEIGEGEVVKFKNRYYCWTKIHGGKWMKLSEKTLGVYSIKPGDRLLSIRGSNIAFDYAAKGPLFEKGLNTKRDVSKY